MSDWKEHVHHPVYRRRLEFSDHRRHMSATPLAIDAALHDYLATIPE